LILSEKRVIFFNMTEFELKKEIGKRVHAVRKKLGLTQQKMVASFNIGRANYSRVETGGVSPNCLVLNALRKVHNISLDWVISGDGEMFADRDEARNERGNNESFGEYTEEVLDLLNCIEHIPMVKHSVLKYFLEYKHAHEELINESQDTGNNKIKDRAI
jgi:transcriptional regulator with XRE-family HTH domain